MLFLDKKIGAAKIYNGLKQVSIGKDSQLYPEAKICNLNGDPKNILIGNNTHIRGELMTMNYGGKIEIGDNCFIGEGSRIWSGESIKIGSNILISHNANIIDTNSHEVDHIQRTENYKKLLIHGHPKDKGSIKTDKIIIHDHVWISFNVTILKGVTIGEGAIIGANSVVTENVPPFTLVVGNPAIVIKKIN